jgi:molybdate transport system ATP-binding protein
LEDLADHPMSQLSFGQQRLTLIARAMVKTPKLLILDEPCNGLDAANRRRVLQMVETIAATGRTNLLYISHRPDEMPRCITHRLRLDAGRVIAGSTV